MHLYSLMQTITSETITRIEQEFEQEHNVHFALETKQTIDNSAFYGLFLRFLEVDILFGYRFALYHVTDAIDI